MDAYVDGKEFDILHVNNYRERFMSYSGSYEIDLYLAKNNDGNNSPITYVHNNWIKHNT